MGMTLRMSRLENEIEKLIARVYLQQFMRKETKLEQETKIICTLNELPEII